MRKRKRTQGNVRRRNIAHLLLVHEGDQLVCSPLYPRDHPQVLHHVVLGALEREGPRLLELSCTKRQPATGAGGQQATAGRRVNFFRGDTKPELPNDAIRMRVWIRDVRVLVRKGRGGTGIPWCWSISGVSAHDDVRACSATQKASSAVAFLPTSMADRRSRSSSAIVFVSYRQVGLNDSNGSVRWAVGQT